MSILTTNPTDFFTKPTNELLGDVLEMVDALIKKAEADAENSEESEARDQAKDDSWRAKTLKEARALLAQCERD
jgi:hypothetical protein